MSEGRGEVQVGARLVFGKTKGNGRRGISHYPPRVRVGRGLLWFPGREPLEFVLAVLVERKGEISPLSASRSRAVLWSRGLEKKGLSG